LEGTVAVKTNQGGEAGDGQGEHKPIRYSIGVSRGRSLARLAEVGAGMMFPVNVPVYTSRRASSTTLGMTTEEGGEAKGEIRDRKLESRNWKIEIGKQKRETGKAK